MSRPEHGAVSADATVNRAFSEIFTPQRKGDALRSMKAPGTAYNNKDFGKDPQPDHMERFEHLPDTDEGDWGGVQGSRSSRTRPA